MADRSLATPRIRPPILKWPSHSTQNSSGSLLGSPRREKVMLENSKIDEAMAACFLQYCAMCEKQITTPSNSLLYCSEACRRKDSNKPLSAAIIMAASPTTSSPPSSPRPILQPRTPTGLSSSTFTPSSRIPTDNHSYKSDLDPTEWKPKSMRPSRPNTNRYNSEAFRYLSTFHRAINKNESNDNDTPNEIKIEVLDYNGNIAMTAPTTPSLGNTPTTTAASSWSMSTSAGYDYNTRPLMPRHNRWYSTSVIGGGGVDLVTPHIPPPPENTYAKKDVVVDMNGKGGLGAFFGEPSE